uniref:Serum response factor-binding protein 1 n=1 Tax=Ditylenchus dipsaci TaxID=166011 RepID=A0A915D0T8_9BILA
MSELTAKELNNVIVNLRDVVGGAIVRASRKLIAQMRRYEKARNQKKKKRIQKYEAEMAAMKKLKKDDVSKFALVNVKSLAEFRFTNETPVEEVALYKVATESSLTAAVDEIRKTYPSWHQEIPFILQRLGIHSKDRMSKQVEEDQKIANDVADVAEGVYESLLEDDVKPAVKKKRRSRNCLRRHCLKERGAPVENIRRGEAVIKRINLGDAETLVKSSSGESGLELDQGKTESSLIAKHRKNGGFFLGQQADESDDTESDSESERPRRAVSRLDHPKKPSFRNPNIASGVKKKDSHSFKRKQMGFEDEKLADSQDRKDAKQLHPSWSAKQMKLKQEAELMKAPPQNKRMTFDD